MPLTVFSLSQRKELDVKQLLVHLSTRLGRPVESTAAIPEAWRQDLRTDLQCPCCFAFGAEVVRDLAKNASGRARRQSFFRFTTPGHRPHCDYASAETANAVPENLVSFGESRSHLTRAVRRLVCTAIEKGTFDQGTIRDMREWFFRKKVEALFTVAVDARLPGWIDDLLRLEMYARAGRPQGVALMPDLAALPGFDWRAEASRSVWERHPEYAAALRLVREHRAFFGRDLKPRVEALARRYQGRQAFDPLALADEYQKAIDMATFIGCNYDPLKHERSRSGVPSCVLALSALLLYRRGWDLGLACADFASLAAGPPSNDETLGNVMGLNPFHDYEAWRALRLLQDACIVNPVDWDVMSERTAAEKHLRHAYGANSVERA